MSSTSWPRGRSTNGSPFVAGYENDPQWRFEVQVTRNQPTAPMGVRTESIGVLRILPAVAIESRDRVPEPMAPRSDNIPRIVAPGTPRVELGV